MKRKFVKVMFFGALALSTVTYVGCKDYDDDVKGLQEQIDNINQKGADVTTEAMNAAISSAIAKVQADLDKIASKADKSALDALQAVVTKLQEAVNGKADASTLESLKAELNEAIATVDSSIQPKIDAAKTQLEGQIAALETKLEEADEAIKGSIATQIADLKTELQDLMAANAAEYAKLYATKVDLNALSDRVETLEKIKHLKDKALGELGEEKAKIFSAYEMLLSDKMLTDPIKKAIESGAAAKTAIQKVTKSMADMLASKNNEYMRQRADDIRYIGELLCEAVVGSKTEFEFPSGDDKYIIAAHELTPVDTMLFDRSRIAGLVTELGGATSHTVILAKSLGIPAVVGVSGILENETDTAAYLDGYSGKFIVSPDEKTKAEYDGKIKEEEVLTAQMNEIKGTEAYTADGEKIAVCINIGKPSDMKNAEGEKLDGVGLFRSEFLFSSEKEMPTCDEQTEAYREVIKAASPNYVTIRTLDVGGDKQIKYLNMQKEENPFLGERGIRLMLNNPDVFKTQIRAILIAAADEKVKIMLPMITSLDEIRAAKKIIAEVQAELESGKIAYCKEPLVGIMIETPASAIMADVFAKHADFFSIGTNDLVQYIMAADRGNYQVENLYNPYHPAVIYMLNNIIRAGRDANIEVSVCGDLAANTDFTELLLGMGLKKFSVPQPMASRIKYKISGINLDEARELKYRALAAEDETEVKNILKKIK